MADPIFEISAGGSLPALPEGRPTAAEKSDAPSCVDSLKYEDIWKGNATIARKNTVRLHNLGGGKLEVQLAAPTAIVMAQVLVQPKIKEAFGTAEGQKFHETIRKTVVQALRKSLETHKTHLVTVKIPPLEAPQYTITSAAISPYPKGTHPTSAEKSDANACIGELTYDKIFKKEGEITKRTTVRLDAQAATPEFRNLQIQINGIPRPSTIAQVLVDTALNEKYSTAEGEKFHGGIRNMVADHLKKSVDDKKSYKIMLKK